MQLTNPSLEELIANSQNVTAIAYRDLVGDQVIPDDLNLPELTDLGCLSSNTSLANLFALLCKAPKLRKLVLSGCENLAGGAVVPADLNLSELTDLDCLYSNISLANLFALLRKAPKLKMLVLRGHVNLAGELIIPNDLDLSKLTELYCSYSNIRPADLFTLIRKAPKLRKLVLRVYDNLAGEAVVPDDLDLSELTELDCSDSDISPDNLFALLRKAPKLKMLVFSGRGNLDGEVVIPDDLNLPELTELDCSDSSISLGNLFALLRKAPKLKKLVLRDCTNLAGEAVVPDDLDLSELTELDCSGSSISLGNLFALLRKAPKLEKLVLRERTNLAGEAVIPDDLDLSELTVFDCSDPDISPANLFALLRKAPKLKMLVFSGRVNLAGDQVIPADLNLSELTDLDCLYSNISLANLFALLRKAPKLKKLVLSEYGNLAGDAVIPDDLNLSELTVLDCSYSNISPANIFALIRKAPKLAKLVFRGCGNLAGELVVPDNLNLSELTELDCSGSNLSLGNLFALLRKAPKLKMLVFGGRGNFDGKAVVPADLNLSELTDLDCSYSNIGPANLFALLCKAPKLKMLDLRECDNLSGKAIIPVDLNLSTLKQISVQATAIPPNGVLASIFKAAINLETLNLSGCANLSEEQTLNLISFIANNMQIEIQVCDDFGQEDNLSATQTQLLNALAKNKKHREAARLVLALATPNPPEPQKPIPPVVLFNKEDGDCSLRFRVALCLSGVPVASNPKFKA